METLMKDIDYHTRLKIELEEVIKEQKSRLLTDQILMNSILARVREIFLSEIIARKTDNEALANYLETLSNKILLDINLTNEKYKTEKIKIESRVELLEALISKSEREKEAALQKIILERNGKEEREKRDIRKIGERPETIKEKRRKTETSIQKDMDAFDTTVGEE